MWCAASGVAALSAEPHLIGPNAETTLVLELDGTRCHVAGLALTLLSPLREEKINPSDEPKV